MEELENIGWNKMSAILNKEMPVKKKRRVAIYWWIGSAAAAVLFTIAAFLLSESSGTKLEQNSTSHNEAYPKDKNLADVNSQELINQGNNEDYKPSSSNVTLQNDRTVHKKNQATNDSQKSLNELNSINVSSVQKPNLSLIHETASQTSLQITTPLNESESYEYKKEQFDIQVLTFYRQTLHLAQREQLHLHPIIKPHNSLALKVGIDVVYANASRVNYSEYGAGISGLLEFNKRWSLVSGLRFLKRGKLFGEKDLAELELVDLNTGGGFAASNPSTPRSIDVANEINFSQLQLSLGARYNLNTRLAIDGSLSPSYVLINEEDYSRWYNQPLVTGGQNNVADAVTVTPKKWNAHLGIGLNYVLTNNVNIGLSYNYLLSRNGRNALLEPNFESDEWQVKMSYLLD